jgi:hypothetical protein
VGLKDIGYDCEDVTCFNLAQDWVNSKSCENNNETSGSISWDEFSKAVVPWAWKNLI